MELILYKDFGKRKNSTKQPDSTVQSVTKQVRLKQGTSVLSPTFLLSDPDPNYNYCKWRWRYYYITDIVLNNDNVYEIQCEVDPMASWKNNIGASNQYVLRTSDVVKTPDGTCLYPDGMYPARGVPTVNMSKVDMGIPSALTTGIYVVQTSGLKLVNNDILLNSSVLMFSSGDSSLINLSNFLNGIANDTILGSGTLSTYIKRITYYPNVETIPAGQKLTVTAAYLGGSIGQSASTPVTGAYALADLAVGGGEVTLTLPNHPQAASRGIWLNYSQYTSMTIDWPMVGVIDVPISCLIKDGNAAYTLKLLYNVDYISGSARVRLDATYANNGGTQTIKNILVGQWGSDFMAEALQTPIPNMVKSAFSALAGMGKTPMNTIAGAANLLDPSNYANNVESIGTIGGRSKYAPMTVRYTYYELAPEDRADKGRPYMLSDTISTFQTGSYIKCNDVHIGWQAMPSEKDAITSYMESGFFYE